MKAKVSNRTEEDKPERPTLERLQHASHREEPITALAGAKTRIRITDGSEIDRLYLGGHLTQDQHHTLELFSQDLYEAGMVFCPRAGITPSSSTGGGQFIADEKARRVKRVERHMQELATVLTRDARAVVLDALIGDRKIKAKQTVLMVMAAEVLAPLYDPRHR